LVTGRILRPPYLKVMSSRKELVRIPDEVIMNKIILLRQKKVMIDRDLADIYGVTTKRLNEQVKRNKKRFPDDFMFKVTKKEKDQIIFQFPHLDVLKFSSSLPNVFTEHGAVMLASVLDSEKAINANIQIVRIFTKIRQILTDTSDLRHEINQIKRKIHKQDKNLELLFKHLDDFVERKEQAVRTKIGYTTVNNK
jgi:hypothetical protein